MKSGKKIYEYDEVIQELKTDNPLFKDEEFIEVYTYSLPIETHKEGETRKYNILEDASDYFLDKNFNNKKIEYAIVLNKLNLNDKEIEKDIKCREWIFYKEIDFSETTFTGTTDFFLATFNGLTNFSGVTFNGEADFREATISGEAIFSGTTFRGVADFSGTTFCGVAYFRDLKLYKQSKLRLNDTIFYNRVDFSFEDLCGKILFNKTSFREDCYLPFSELDEKDFAPLKINNENERTKENFRIAEQIYKTTNQIDEQLVMHYYYKKYSRKLKYKLINSWKPFQVLRNLWNIILRFCSWLFLDLTSKYFTSWGRVLVTMLFVYFAYVIAYFAFAENLKVHINKEMISLPLCNLELFDYIRHILYFSLITFTTIGYGDIHPQGWLQIISGSEGFLGIILSAMFVVTLAKRLLG